MHTENNLMGRIIEGLLYGISTGMLAASHKYSPHLWVPIKVLLCHLCSFVPLLFSQVLVSLPC